MKQNVLLIALMAIYLSCSNLLHAQIKESPFVVSFGSGFANISGKKGVLLHMQGNSRLYKNFGVSVNTGMATAASNTKERINAHVPGFYGASTYYYINAGLFYQQPLLNDKMNIIFDATAGVRKNNSLEIFVNSNQQATTIKDKSIRFGFSPGVNANFKIINKHSIGLAYRHDFYYEGSDFFLVNWLYEL